MIDSVTGATVSGTWSGTAAADRAWRIAVRAALLYIVAFAAVPAERIGIGTVMTVAGDLAAVVMILAGVRRYKPRRSKAWLLIAGGFAAWGIADAMLGAFESAGDVPNPSTADVFYLLGYGLLVAGLLRAVRVRSPVFDVRALFDPAIVTAGAAFFAWVYIGAPAVRDDETSGFFGGVTGGAAPPPAALLSIATRLA